MNGAITTAEVAVLAAFLMIYSHQPVHLIKLSLLSPELDCLSRNIVTWPSLLPPPCQFWLTVLKGSGHLTVRQYFMLATTRQFYLLCRPTLRPQSRCSNFKPTGEYVILYIFILWDFVVHCYWSPLKHNRCAKTCRQTDKRDLSPLRLSTRTIHVTVLKRQLGCRIMV